MRVFILALAVFALSQTAEAQGAPTEIALSPPNFSGQVSGTTLPDKPLTFFVRAPSRGDMKINVAADNGPCGFEMQRSSSASFQSEMGRFPASRTFMAQEGETFTFSFYQTRSAFMERKGCSFTLSVN